MIKTTIKSGKRKVRVNITVDKDALEKAKTKLNLFGGKLSTLFNAYLSDFISTIDKKVGETHKSLINEVRDLEKRIRKMEEKVDKKDKLKPG